MVEQPDWQEHSGRAMLTDREREIVSGEADVSNDYYWQTVSRVRKRFERLAADIETMDEHETLGEEFRELVCGGGN